MKKLYILLALAFVSTSMTIAQVSVTLRINHKLGDNTFLLNTTAQNNAAQSFKVTRLQYFISRISVVHDGGNILAISDDVLDLINANDGDFSSIDLGQLNVTSVEGVKFHIGVFQPLNNANPALQPAGSPLAPQSPSMHWGWASGYRFLAYEGLSGINFAQTFQIHSLGNANYFEVDVPVTGQLASGAIVISIDGDYTKGMEDIDLDSGPIAHGVNQEDLDVLLNFKNLVFSASTESLGLESQSDLEDFTFFPNPSEDKFYVSTASDYSNLTAKVYDVNGSLLGHYDLNTSQEISVSTAGLYFVALFRDGVNIGTQKLVKK